MAEGSTTFCSNCKRHIASINYVMHEVHCKRNIVLCEHCEEPVPRSELDEHFNEVHAPAECPLCNTKVEKSTLESHQTETCPKRTSKCDFCELELPHCDLPGHKEYCGTRTEQCPLCKQYIMQKDQTRHEESSCLYPPQKNTANPSKNNHRAELYGEQGLDVFRMDELSRILGEPPRMRTSRPGIIGHGAKRNQLGAPRSSHTSYLRADGSRSINQNRTSSKSVNHDRVSDSQSSRISAKRTNETSSQRSRFNHSNQSAERLHPRHDIGDELDADEDSDLQLAMQLAHDLQLDGPLEYNSGNSDEISSRRRSRSSPRSLHGDAINIPCEFCGDPFPVELLIQHQSHCNHDNQLDSLENPEGIDIPTLESMEPNNSPRRHLTANTHGQPHILDNLSSSHTRPHVDNVPYQALEHEEVWQDPTGHEGAVNDSIVMLPCEFCNQQFPIDNLVQHQAVCDSNTTLTPRTQSPAITRSIAHRQTRSRASAAAAAVQSKPTVRTTRRQHDPTLQGILGEDAEDSTKPVRRPVIPKKKTNLNRDSNRNHYFSRRQASPNRDEGSQFSEHIPSAFSVPSGRQPHQHRPPVGLLNGLVSPTEDGDSSIVTGTRPRDRPRRKVTGNSSSRNNNGRRENDNRDNLDRLNSHLSVSNGVFLDKKMKSQRNQQRKEGSYADMERNGTDFATGNANRKIRNRNTADGSNVSVPTNTTHHRKSSNPRTAPRHTYDLEDDLDNSALRVAPSHDSTISSSSQRTSSKSNPRRRRYPEGDV